MKTRIHIQLCGMTVFAFLMLPGCSSIYDHYGGNFKGKPAEMDQNINPRAKELIKSALDGFEEIGPVDYHTHIFGNGLTGLSGFCDIDNSGIILHPDMYSWSHPWLRLKTSVIMSAAGIDDFELADKQFAARFFDLVRHFPAPGKFYIYAMEAYHDDKGKRQLDKSDIFVPNEYILAVKNCLNAKLEEEELNREVNLPRFEAVFSVHPYREDAVQILDDAFQDGVRYIKWLPPTMNILPNPPEDSGIRSLVIKYYKKMASLNMVLLTHTGHEETSRSDDDKADFADPERLHLALEYGVTVVMLHSGRFRKGSERNYYFSRFMKMMSEPKYRGKLFGEITALTLPKSQNLLIKVMEDLNRAEESVLKCRMVNGSDYLLPAVYSLRPTKGKIAKTFFTSVDIEALEQIYAYNPLLYGFVVKRTIVHKGTGTKLPSWIFQSLESKMGSGQDSCE